jgi:hypothetical protein
MADDGGLVRRQVVTAQITGQAEGADPVILLIAYDKETVEVCLGGAEWTTIFYPSTFGPVLWSVESYLATMFKDDDPDDEMDVQLSAFNHKAETWSRTRLKSLPSLVAAYFKEAIDH